METRIPTRRSQGEVPNFLSKNLPPIAKITSGIAIEYPNSHASDTADHPALGFLSSVIYLHSLNLSKTSIPDCYHGFFCLLFSIFKFHLNASTFSFLSSFGKMSRVKNPKNLTLNFGLNKALWF